MNTFLTKEEEAQYLELCAKFKISPWIANQLLKKHVLKHKNFPFDIEKHREALKSLGKEQEEILVNFKKAINESVSKMSELMKNIDSKITPEVKEQLIKNNVNIDEVKKQLFDTQKKLEKNNSI